MIESPFNYTGGKYKLLSQILPLFPKDINCFFDIFCGGCNVGINTINNKIVFNDSEIHLIKLLRLLYVNELNQTLNTIESIIQKYKLSSSKYNGYEFYKCNSSNGLANYNNDKYLKLRNDFNSRKRKDNYYYYMFYVLIIYSFNNQIRFNSKGEFNLPCGKRDFNKKMEAKLISFINAIKQKRIEFTDYDFRKIRIEDIQSNDFVYADPPYLITCASYNESNGWNQTDEIDLLNFLDKLDSRGVKFALSNVLYSKNKTNNILKQWIENNKKYKVYHLNKDYSNSNYHRTSNYETDEILVVNY